MPQPPGVFDRVNYLIEMWERPCGASWWIYIRTAGPAVLDLVTFLLCFDIGDVIRWFFKPGYAMARDLRKSGRFAGRGGHGGGLGRGGRRKTPSILRRLSDKLPGMKKLRQRKVTKGVIHLWVIDGIIQRVLWYWLLVEGISGALYNWTSLLYRTEECRSAHGPSIGREGDDPQNIGGLGTQSALHWKSADDIGDDWQVTSTHTGNPKSTLWHLVVAASVSNNSESDAYARLGVGVDRESGFEYETTDYLDVIKGDTVSFALDLQYRGKVNAPAFLQNWGGSLTVDTSLMLIWEIPVLQGSPVTLGCHLRDVLSL